MNPKLTPELFSGKPSLCSPVQASQLSITKKALASNSVSRIEPRAGFQRIVVVDDDLGRTVRVWSIVRASNDWSRKYVAAR